MTGCCLITFCFSLWNYWKETITSHNHLQYCVCIAEYWIDIMSIEFGSTSVVILLCIFYCLLKRKWKERGKWLKFLCVLQNCPCISRSLSYHPLFCNNNNSILPLHSTRIFKRALSRKVVCLVFTPAMRWLHKPYQTSIVHMRKLRHRELVTCGDQYYYDSAIASELLIPTSKHIPLITLLSK